MVNQTEANGGHNGDQTLDRTQSLCDRTRPVSAQRVSMFRFSDRTRWRVRSRSTGRVRSLWELTRLQPDADTVTSSATCVRVRSLLRWSVARLDQCVRSVMGPARPVVLRAWVVYAPARSVRVISASGQRDYSCFECLIALFEGVTLGLLIILALLCAEHIPSHSSPLLVCLIKARLSDLKCICL
jgi:hypothetical protein